MESVRLPPIRKPLSTKKNDNSLVTHACDEIKQLQENIWLVGEVNIEKIEKAGMREQYKERGRRAQKIEQRPMI
jgi:hypothetical protein